MPNLTNLNSKPNLSYLHYKLPNKSSQPSISDSLTYTFVCFTLYKRVIVLHTYSLGRSTCVFWYWCVFHEWMYTVRRYNSYLKCIHRSWQVRTIVEFRWTTISMIIFRCLSKYTLIEQKRVWDIRILIWFSYRWGSQKYSVCK